MGWITAGERDANDLKRSDSLTTPRYVNVECTGRFYLSSCLNVSPIVTIGEDDGTS